MAGTTDIPERARFSLLYLRQGKPGTDSKRMRARLGVLVGECRAEGLYDTVLRKFGRPVPFLGERLNWVKFFEAAQLDEALDTITFAFDAIQAARYTTSAEAVKFLREVNLIFQEEHVAYRADSGGVVRYAVDQEFETSRMATLAGLGQSRFVNARNNFEEAYNELSKTPADGKGAIRAAFDAAENVFKVMFKNEPRLTAAKANTCLTPVLQQRYSGNGPATAAALRQLAAFCDWIEGAQHYRHEHNQEKVIEPPLEIAVLFVSTGSSYLRWLIDIDAEINKSRD